MGSPTAERTIQILDFLTTHPGRGFTLSELSRQLRISKSTAQKILQTLSERALVLRNPDSFEFRLGPALIPMGTVAEGNFLALTHAKREAELLAQEHDAECFIVMVTGDELLNVGYTGVPGPLSTPFREGQRLPLAPPIGTLALAWTSDEAIETWLNRLGLELTSGERAQYREAVDVVRRRGYSIGIRTPELDALRELYASANMHTPDGRRRLSAAFDAFAHHNHLLAGDGLPADTEISGVGAPVFGPDGNLLFAICIASTHYHMRDVPSLSRAVLRAAGRVMAATGGRHPWLASASLTPAATSG
jgi:DNA-binding IclR family transcriptional regulator